MNRSEWNAPNFRLTYIHENVYNIISEVIQIEDIHRSIYDGWFYLENLSYGFSFLKISASEKTKLSSFSQGTVAKIVWEACSQGDPSLFVEDGNPNTKEACTDYLNAFFDHLNALPEYSKFIDLRFRAEKGTHIKLSNFIQKLQPGLSSDELSTICAEITDKLRMFVEHDTTCVHISEKPSEIYTKSSPKISSCMVGARPSKFSIYDDMENTKIAYITDKRGDLLARALIHESVKTDRGEVISIMDRIYAASNNHVAIMINYAKQNGIYYKQNPTSGGCNTYVHPETGETIDRYLTMEVHNLVDKKYKEVPYIDTFRYALSHTLLSSNYSGCLTEFSRTDGRDTNNIVVKQSVRCYSCDDIIEDSIIVGNRRYCQACYDRLFTTCSHCGAVIRRDSHGNGLCSDCESSMFVCSSCGDRHFADEAVFSEGSTDIICNACYDNSRTTQRTEPLLTCAICGQDTHDYIMSPSRRDADVPVCRSCSNIIAMNAPRTQSHRDDIVMFIR